MINRTWMTPEEFRRSVAAEPVCLEALIRNRQDELRGRPLYRHEKIAERIKGVDWDDVVVWVCTLMMGCCCLATLALVAMSLMLVG